MNICTDFPFELTIRDAAEALRVTEDFMDEFEDTFRECMQIARPGYCFAEFEASIREDRTHIGDVSFDSRILRINLKNVHRAFPGVISCGRAIYDLARSNDDPLVRYWIDGIAEMLMEQAGQAMRSRIQEICGCNIRAVSPGSLGDFPLIEQKKLFHLLGDAPSAIGVELTPQCLMLPGKSASGIYFESDEEYENCMLCLRQGCPKRRAAFDEHAFIEKFGLSEADVRQVPGR